MRLRSFVHRHADSILNSNYRLKKEIESILLNLELSKPQVCPRFPALSIHQQIQGAFLRHQWQAEYLVTPRTAHRKYFDVYKEGVAIEIELSHRERLYRDYLRFMMAEMAGRLDVGIIVLLDGEAKGQQPAALRHCAPQLEDVMDDLQQLRSSITVPIWAIALS